MNPETIEPDFVDRNNLDRRSKCVARLCSLTAQRQIQPTPRDGTIARAPVLRPRAHRDTADRVLPPDRVVELGAEVEI